MQPILGAGKGYISWPTIMWGPALVMVCVVRLSVCLSHANISETKRDRLMVTMKREKELGLLDSEPVIRFAIRSTVSPFWVLPG